VRVLCVHGRGGELTTCRDELVSAVEWDFPAVPAVASFWKLRRFSEQVTQVDGWLDSTDLAAGKSYGAWLLLAAAVQRVERGRGFPPLALWNAPLGEARHLNGALVGYRAPRAARVRRALGIAAQHHGAILPTARLAFVYDGDSRQATDADASQLCRVGFDVHFVGSAGGDAGPGERRLRSLVAAFAADLVALRELRAAAGSSRQLPTSDCKLPDNAPPFSKAS
jgi:hypothetical protein